MRYLYGTLTKHHIYRIFLYDTSIWICYISINTLNYYIISKPGYIKPAILIFYLCVSTYGSL